MSPLPNIFLLSSICLNDLKVALRVQGEGTGDGRGVAGEWRGEDDTGAEVLDEGF